MICSRQVVAAPVDQSRLRISLRTGSSKRGVLGAEHAQLVCQLPVERCMCLPAVAAAGMVRHLLTDPVLPEGMLPADWPGNALRESYARFAEELLARREQTELVEAT